MRLCPGLLMPFLLRAADWPDASHLLAERQDPAKNTACAIAGSAATSFLSAQPTGRSSSYTNAEAGRLTLT